MCKFYTVYFSVFIKKKNTLLILEFIFTGKKIYTYCLEILHHNFIISQRFVATFLISISYNIVDFIARMFGSVLN